MPITHVHPMLISDHVFEILALALSSEPKIAASRNTVENLKNLYERHLAVVLMQAGEPIGFIAAWPVEEGYLEIGSVWVHPDHRGRGLSHTIYESATTLLAGNGHIVFQVTINPLAVRSGQAVGLSPVPDWTSPVPWHLTCEPCEFVASAQQCICPHRNVTCHLQVMNHT